MKKLVIGNWKMNPKSLNIALQIYKQTIKGIKKSGSVQAVVCVPNIYLGSLVVAPLLVYFSLGTYLDISRLLQTLVILILIPLIISRPCRRINNFVFDNSLVFINLIFFLVIYVAVGSNIEILIFDLTFYLVFSIIFVRNFVFGTLVYLISKRLNFSKVDAVNNTLFSVYKNGGLSVVFAIELAGGYSILAPVMSVLLSAPLFLYLSFLFKRFN